MIQSAPNTQFDGFCHFAIYTNIGMPHRKRKFYSDNALLLMNVARTHIHTHRERKYRADKSLIFRLFRSQLRPACPCMWAHRREMSIIIIGGCCLIALRDHSINWKLVYSNGFWVIAKWLFGGPSRAFGVLFDFNASKVRFEMRLAMLTLSVRSARAYSTILARCDWRARVHQNLITKPNGSHRILALLTQ